MLYIQFEIKDLAKFEALKRVYNVLFEIKPKEESKPIEFWQEMIPNYAKDFLGGYYEEEKALSMLIPASFTDTINYLEFGLEVDLEGLVQVDETKIRLDYTALSFPYGGMDRLMIFLKAYDCIPCEAYTGFSVVKLNWTSAYDYEATELAEETQLYRANGYRK